MKRLRSSTQQYEEDMISRLPDHILHIIMNFLSLKDTIRTSVLSKAWNSTYSSYPKLVFHQLLYEDLKKGLKNRENNVAQNFCNHVDRSIERRLVVEKSIEKLELVLRPGSGRGAVVHDQVDRWINHVTNNRVKQFVLDYCYDPKNINPGGRYVLPWSLLTCNSSLQNLELYGCDIVGSSLSTLPGIKIGIGFSLRKLRLSEVFIDDYALRSVVSSCCLLEEFGLKFCYGFAVLKVVGLQKLHTVELHLEIDQVPEVTIQAPDLKYMCYEGGCPTIAPKVLAVSYHKKLEKITLRNTTATEEFLRAVPEFPLLEKLELNECKLAKILRISSNRLKCFYILDCHGAEDIELDTRCLDHFQYIGGNPLRINWIKASDKIRIDILFHNYNYCYNSLSFNKVCEFLLNLSSCGDLTVTFEASKYLLLEQVNKQTPFSAKFVKLWPETIRYQCKRYSILSFLKEFLRVSHRPSTIQIQVGKTSSFASLKIEFLYEEQTTDDWTTSLSGLRIAQSQRELITSEDILDIIQFCEANASMSFIR